MDLAGVKRFPLRSRQFHQTAQLRRCGDGLGAGRHLRQEEVTVTSSSGVDRPKDAHDLAEIRSDAGWGARQGVAAGEQTGWRSKGGDRDLVRIWIGVPCCVEGSDGGFVG